MSLGVNIDLFNQARYSPNKQYVIVYVNHFMIIFLCIINNLEVLI